MKRYSPKFKRKLIQKIAGTLTAFRHGTGLTPRNHAVVDELHQLQHIATHAAAETLPSLLVQHDMKAIGGMAEYLVGFMQATGELYYQYGMDWIILNRDTFLLQWDEKISFELN